MKHFLSILAMTVVSVCCLGMPGVSVAQAQEERSRHEHSEIWLAPQGLGPPRPSAVDYTDLFTPDAHWKLAASHTQVFKFYSGYLLYASQVQVDAMVADLNRRGIAIAIEVGVMNVPPNPLSGCGGLGNVEGYGTVARANRISQIIKNAHGQIKYIAMDEPLYYGHYYTHFPGKGTGCHSSIDEVLRLIKPTLDAFIQQFPNIAIGDIEPTLFVGDQPNWHNDLVAWATGFQAIVGRPLAFYELDVEWSRPNGPQEAVAIYHAAEQLKQRHLIEKIGVIYNGTPRDTSDAAWVQDAQSHVRLIEGKLKLHPDQAVFQSWNPYPTHALPDTADDTLTGLVNFYLDPAVRKRNEDKQ